MRRSTGSQTRCSYTMLAVALAALLLLAACGPAPTVPREEEKVVNIGLLLNLTGSVGTPNQLGLLSLGDGLRYWNKEKGIPGITVELTSRDHKYDRVLEMSAYRSCIDGGALAIVIFTPPGMFKPMVEKDEVPMLAGSITG